MDNDRAQEVDYGESFPPSNAGPNGQAPPKSLDHFRRGYHERAEMRHREEAGDNDKELPPVAGDYDRADGPPPPEGIGHSQSFDRGGPPHHHDDFHPQGPPAAAGRGPPRSAPIPRNRDDMTFREYRRYMEENPQLQEQQQRGGGGRGGRRGSYQYGGGGHHGGGSHIIKGMDIQALVDRLQRAHNQAGVAQELELAREKHREVFDSGKALTAIISSVARRRNMNLAKAIWDWIDHAGIPKNTFHYNSMISACEKVKDYRKALHLMDEMKQKNIAKNEVT